MAEVRNGMDKAAMIQLTDKAICRMTDQIAKIQVVRTCTSEFDSVECCSLVLKTSGDYEALLILSAEDTVFREIARRMKRADKLTQEDITVYTTEYYNMLCGFLISHLNHTLGLKSRFGIAQLMKECYIRNTYTKDGYIKLFYECPYGKLEFQSIGLPVNL